MIRIVPIGIGGKISPLIDHMMLKEESTTKIIVDTYTEAGFDPARDQLMMYQLIEGNSPPQWRSNGAGGLMIDWNLKTSLDHIGRPGRPHGEPFYWPGDGPLRARVRPASSLDR